MLPYNPFNGPEHTDFTISGDKPAALLVHGFPGTPAEMRPLAKSLNERGWTVRGLLLPGFGSDLDTLPRRRAEDWIRAIKEALVDLRATHNPIMLVGISMGAALSLRVVQETPADGLVILAPFWRLSSVVWPLLPVLCRLIPSLKPFQLVNVDYHDSGVRSILKKFFPRINPDDPQARRKLRDFILPTGMFNEIRRAGIAAYRAAAQVRVPVLIVQGIKDEVARTRMTRKLLRRYAGPVRYAEIPATHDLLDATQPVWGMVRSLILEFAGRLELLAKPSH
jgi:carboxylesterase